MDDLSIINYVFTCDRSVKGCWINYLVCLVVFIAHSSFLDMMR